MRQRIPSFVQGECRRLARVAVAGLVALSMGASAPTFAQEPGEQTFASADDAAHALFVAMQSQDEQSALKVLGPAAKEVLSSGDPSEDGDARVEFVVRYQKMHRLVTEPDGP